MTRYGGAQLPYCVGKAKADQSLQRQGQPGLYSTFKNSQGYIEKPSLENKTEKYQTKFAPHSRLHTNNCL